MDEQPLRRADELALRAVRSLPSLPPDAIRALREGERVSQAVLARYLGVRLVSQWGGGAKRSAGASLKVSSLDRAARSWWRL